MAKVVLFLLWVFLLLSTAAGRYGRLVGGRTEVTDVESNREVQELGRFSVKEFNKQIHDQGNSSGEELMFSQVVQAQRQVVSGIKYFLKVEATTKNAETKVFDCVVVVKAWLHSKELVSFQPSTQLWVRK